MQKSNSGAPPPSRSPAIGTGAPGAAARCDLSAADGAQLRLRMTERRARLLMEICDLQGYGVPSPAGSGPGVQAGANARAAQVPAATRRLLELRDIEASLRHMDAGDYGICGDCGRAIERERILVLPTATRCRPCDERHVMASADPLAGPSTWETKHGRRSKEGSHG
ncbi:MAG: TraR/DksA C4-type zinc finger protein [Betaproteobacteria bacterium]|nr:TraR/DksA C4-type zinc finger protein [Betaproteobacteria bacterium]